VKFLFIAKTQKAIDTFKQFDHAVNHKSMKEKLAIASLSALGANVKSKVISEKPFKIKVWYALLRKMDKNMASPEQFADTWRTQWFPELVYKQDYEARLI